ncbi:MAG: hypothetical protein Q9166_001118 [cf. Caloplaca sp. 2 TL-2023]
MRHPQDYSYELLRYDQLYEDDHSLANIVLSKSKLYFRVCCAGIISKSRRQCSLEPAAAIEVDIKTAEQLTYANDDSPTNESSPPSLRVPSIPDYSVEFRDRRDLPVNQLEMYCNSIFAMIYLIKLGWDNPVTFTEFQSSTPWYRSELLIENTVRTNALRYKHLIVGTYDLSVYFAARRLFTTKKAILSILRRPVATISLQNKQPSPPSGSNNALANTAATAAIYGPNPLNTSLTDTPGKFIDPEDPNFIVHYESRPGALLYVDSLFTAFGDALANAAPYDTETLGARISGLGYDRQSRLEIFDAGTVERPLLSWARGVQAIGQIWRGLIELHRSLIGMRFEIEYAGRKLGGGFMKAVTPRVGDDDDDDDDDDA